MNTCENNLLEEKMDNSILFISWFVFIFCVKIRRMFEEPFKTVMLAENKQAKDISVYLLYL